MIIIHLIEEAGLTRHVPVKAVIRCKLNFIKVLNDVSFAKY